MAETVLPATTLAWVERETGGRVIGTETVQDRSVSVHFVTLERGGSTTSLALRRFPDHERAKTDPWYVPANEARTMELLSPTPVLAPELIAADPRGEHCDVPALLTTRLPGTRPSEIANFETFLDQLAEQLIVVHSAITKRPDAFPDYLRYSQPATLEVPGWTRYPEAWERAFEIISGPEPGSAIGFIHRDYHQWNTVWSDGHLTGVVDWNSAAWGPRGIDIGRMRQNLAWDYSTEVAEAFLARCERLGDPGLEDRVYWELVDCADSLPFGPPDKEDDPVKVARFDDFVAGLVAEI